MTTQSKTRIPFPPINLINLVTGGNDVSVFDATGAADLELIITSLAEAGFNSNIGSCRVLDWGCGCARIARHWDVAKSGIDLFGCDVNPILVEWSRENIAHGVFSLCGLLPPLPYPDHHFDVVYGISVLTHLTFDAHFQWMHEIWRVLKPNGMAVLTAHGPTMLPNLMRNIRLAGPGDKCSLPVTLIDEEIFVCVEREQGSNATGNALSTGMFRKIFHPFSIVNHRPRNGLMGIQDTYVIAKKTESPLKLIPKLLESDLRGNEYRADFALDLSGERQLGVLADARDLYFPATIQLSLRRSCDESPIAISGTMNLPDKTSWSQLDAAYALLTIDNLPAWNGPVTLSVDVKALRRDRLAFGGLPSFDRAWPPGRGPLDGAKLRLTKALLF